MNFAYCARLDNANNLNHAQFSGPFLRNLDKGGWSLPKGEQKAQTILQKRRKIATRGSMRESKELN